MKNVQKIGAFASLTFGISFSMLIGLLMTIASQGYVPGSGNDPAKALEFAANSSIPYVIYLLYTLFAVLFILIILTLTDRLKALAPVQMQIAVIASSATGVFFLAYAMLGYVGEPMLISVYQQDASVGSTAYLAMRVVSNALNSGAIFAAGWAILLTGWAAIRVADFPKALAGLLLLAGGLSVFAFLIPIFSMFAPLLYVVWSIWLGAFLLRPSSLPIQVSDLAMLVSEK